MSQIFITEPNVDLLNGSNPLPGFGIFPSGDAIFVPASPIQRGGPIFNAPDPVDLPTPPPIYASTNSAFVF